MSTRGKVPATLMEATQYFSDPLSCFPLFVGLRQVKLRLSVCGVNPGDETMTFRST